jgi:hypothetical protein
VYRSPIIKGKGLNIEVFRLVRAKLWVPVTLFQSVHFSS